MKTFKFFKSNLLIHKIFGNDLGDVANLKQLDRVIRTTFDYLEKSDLPNEKISLIFPLMFRLYRNKHNRYSHSQILETIWSIEIWLSDEGMKVLLGMLEDAFMTVDVEAEIIAILQDKLDWNESV